MGSIIKDTLGSVGIGKTSAEESRESSNQLTQEMLSKLDEIGIPPIEAQRLILESPEVVGQLIPELEGVVETIDKSAFEDIETNPELKSAQISALNTLVSDMEDSGVDVESDVDLNKLKRSLAQQVEGADENLVENMASRGLAGSGQELLGRLDLADKSAQSAQDALSGKAQEMITDKLQSARNVGNIARGQRGQEFGEQSQSAQAKDLLNRFNLEQRAGAKQRDTERLNQANLANLQQRQKYHEKDINTKNIQDQSNKALIQQDFQNQMGKAGAAGKVLQGQSQTLQGIAQGEQASSAGQLGAAASLIAASDKNLKVNVESGDNEVEQMLDNIEAYDYDYKPIVDDGERHTSVMAQDLEKSELGDRFVEDTEMGKMVDYEKALPTMMASQGNLNKRLRKIEKVLQLIDDDEEML